MIQNLALRIAPEIAARFTCSPCAYGFRVTTSRIQHRLSGRIEHHSDRSHQDGEQMRPEEITFTVTRGKIIQVDVIDDPARLRKLDLAVLDD
jgi:hypothetical protein